MVSEESVGLKVLPATSIETQVKKKEDFEDDEEQEFFDIEENAKKRMTKKMEIYKVAKVINGMVWCFGIDEGQRCFHINALLLLEKDGELIQENQQ